MNIKLKALLLTLVYIASPFVFLYVLFEYPLIVVFVAMGLVTFLVYNKVLDNLKRDYHDKNGYTLKEFNDNHRGTK